MPPVVIAAAVGAVATVGAGALAASSQKKAAAKAAETATNTSNSNNALARENRDFGFNVLSPFRNTGMQAQNVLSGMLYGAPTSSALPGQSTTQYGAPQMVNESQFLNPGGAPMGMTEEWANGALSSMGLGSRGNSPDTLQRHLRGELEGALSPQMMQAYESYQRNTPMPQTSALAPGAPAGAPTGTVPAKSAWDQFRDSTNYQFRYDEGMKGLNLGLANQGYQGSGMAVKEAIKFGQNFGSNELNNYISILQGQQNIGMGAASAMVGVGNNATNNVMANNTAAGTAAANAGLVSAQATGQMWGNVAQGIGQVAGAVGSSYSQPKMPAANSWSPPTFNGLQSSI